MSSTSFRQHFDMISMHEPVQRKAKFWTSYVRALKDDELFIPSPEMLISLDTRKCYFCMVYPHRTEEILQDFIRSCEKFSHVDVEAGTEDMRAEEGTTGPSRRRPFSEMPDIFPSRMFDDMLPTASTEDANARIRAPGYRYQPVSRETYGHSPRPIQPTGQITSTRRTRY